MPLTTRVSDTETLLAAIRSAYARLEELYPGTIAAAARQEAERLSRIDPRFKYAFSVDESGGELMTLHARENVEAKFELHGPPAIRKWEEMLRTGKPVEFVPGEIRFEEAGIFGELQRKAAGRSLFSPASAATSSEEPMSGVSKRDTPSLTADVTLDITPPEVRDRLLEGLPMTVNVVQPLRFLGEECPTWAVETTLTSVKPTEVARSAIAALPPEELPARCHFESAAGASLLRRLVRRE